MKIVCFIDNLGPGGAQRQITTLARLLKQRGHEVTMVNYNSPGANRSVFRSHLEELAIPIIQIAPMAYFGRIFALRKLLKHIQPDAVVAFQEAASVYAELAGIFGRSWRLVVSERIAIPDSHRSLIGKLRYLHFLADAIVCNSQSNRELIIRTARRLENRIHVIYNAVDLQHFSLSRQNSKEANRSFRFVVLASYQRKKNLANVLRALLLIKQQPESRPLRVDWYGGVGADLSALNEAKEFIDSNELDGLIELHQAEEDARQLYRAADAIMLASFYEGLPNAICEAMACGKPVLASSVCDNSQLVSHKKSGYLFDPSDPVSIANGMRYVSRLSASERLAMGEAGRKRAEQLFDPLNFVDQYLELLERIPHAK